MFGSLQPLDEPLETALTRAMRIACATEGGFRVAGDFIDSAGLRREVSARSDNPAEDAMIAINEAIVRDSETFLDTSGRAISGWRTSSAAVPRMCGRKRCGAMQR